MKLRNIAIAAVATLALAACSDAWQHAGNPLTSDRSMREAKAATPTGTPFTQALTEEYRALAMKEDETWYDFFDSDFFARKAIASAAGDDLGPEDPGLWRLSAEQRVDLDPARVRLVGKLDDGGRDIAPTEAARAQAAYDCWVEEKEERWQNDEIAACRGTFEAAMTALEVALAPPAEEPAPPPPAPPPVVQAPTLYTVFFDFDDASLTPISRAVLDQAVEDWGEATANMSLVGHTDRSGSAAYNQLLSERRAASVQAYMTEQGLRAGRLSASGVGETQPEVQTADGVREARNRRVVIEIDN